MISVPLLTSFLQIVSLPDLMRLAESGSGAPHDERLMIVCYTLAHYRPCAARMHAIDSAATASAFAGDAAASAEHAALADALRVLHASPRGPAWAEASRRWDDTWTEAWDRATGQGGDRAWDALGAANTDDEAEAALKAARYAAAASHSASHRAFQSLRSDEGFRLAYPERVRASIDRAMAALQDTVDRVEPRSRCGDAPPVELS